MAAWLVQSRQALTVSEFLRPAEEFRLFGPSPLLRLAQRLRGLGRTPPQRTRIFALVAFAWLPLFVLSVAQGRADSGAFPFLRDFAVQARFLIELPVLLVARYGADQFSGLAFVYLVRAGLVPKERRAAYDEELKRFAAARDSWLGAIVIVALAYMLAMSERVVGAEYYWWKVNASGDLSPAGYWYYFVARPLLLAQVLAWCRTFVLWSVLLVRLIKLPLALNPFHPDRAAGVAPILRAHGAFMTLGFALSTDLAGALANRLAHGGDPLMSYRNTLIIFVVAVTLLLLAPLLTFGPGLARARHRGMVEHGAMSYVLANRYEKECLKAPQTGAQGPLIELISAHTDDSTSAEVVARTRIVPITRGYLLSFVMAVALPFGIASLVQLPAKQVLDQLLQLLAL